MAGLLDTRAGPCQSQLVLTQTPATAAAAALFIVTARATIPATAIHGEFVRVLGSQEAVATADVRAMVAKYAARWTVTSVTIERCTGFGPGGHALAGAKVSILARDSDDSMKLVTGRAVTGFASFSA